MNGEKLCSHWDVLSKPREKREEEGKREVERGKRKEGRERGQRAQDEVMICKALENVAHHNARTIYHIFSNGHYPWTIIKGSTNKSEITLTWYRLIAISMVIVLKVRLRPFCCSKRNNSTKLTCCLQIVNTVWRQSKITTVARAVHICGWAEFNSSYPPSLCALIMYSRRTK